MDFILSTGIRNIRNLYPINFSVSLKIRNLSQTLKTQRKRRNTGIKTAYRFQCIVFVWFL